MFLLTFLALTFAESRKLLKSTLSIPDFQRKFQLFKTFIPFLLRYFVFWMPNSRGQTLPSTSPSPVYKAHGWYRCELLEATPSRAEPSRALPCLNGRGNVRYFSSEIQFSPPKWGADWVSAYPFPLALPALPGHVGPGSRPARVQGSPRLALRTQ